MGRVETVLRAMESQLTIEMRVQDSRVKRYLQRHLEELSQNIANYKVQGIEVTFMDEPVTPQNAFALFGDLPAAL